MYMYLLFHVGIILYFISTLVLSRFETYNRNIDHETYQCFYAFSRILGRGEKRRAGEKKKKEKTE